MVKKILIVALLIFVAVTITISICSQKDTERFLEETEWIITEQ